MRPFAIRSVLRNEVKHSSQRAVSICRQAHTSSSAGASAEEIQSARQHCSNLLRQYDYPSAVMQPFIPPHARDAYLALRALNVEVARVADTTSHPSVGAIRMQFWRDTVSSSLAGTPRKEPASILLASAAETLDEVSNGAAKFSKNWLHRIIKTREQYLGNPPYPSLGSLERYAENTYSTLLYLTLQALPLNSLTADHLASHIGKATGIATILRGLPILAFPPPPPSHHTSNAKGATPTISRQQGTVTLPLDVMAEAGVQEEQVLREGAAAAGLREAVFAVATRANDHLITAREMLKNLRGGMQVGHDFEHLAEEEFSYSAQTIASGTDRQLQDVNRAFGVVMGPAVATSLWLERLEKVDFDVFHPGLRRTDWKLPLRAYWAFTRRKF